MNPPIKGPLRIKDMLVEEMLSSRGSYKCISSGSSFVERLFGLCPYLGGSFIRCFPVDQNPYNSSLMLSVVLFLCLFRIQVLMY